MNKTDFQLKNDKINDKTHEYEMLLSVIKPKHKADHKLKL